jgi:hypothetical protein
MTQPVTEAQYLAAIARVFNGKTPIGIAFCVAEGYLLTCAHVVSKALGHQRQSYQIPAQEILGKTLTLEFCGQGQADSRRVTVVYWRSPAQEELGNADADVAVLKLAEALPVNAQALSLKRFPEFWEQTFRVSGTPAKVADGVWADGHLKGFTHDHSLVQMVGDPGYAIEPGFSGAPVWSPTLDNAIVGMVVARDKEREEARVGFMVPASKLQPALAAVEIEILMDILVPQATALRDAFAIAYQAALGDRISAFPPSTHPDPTQALRDNLATLISVPIKTAEISRLHLVIAMLTRPALELSEPLRTALTEWLRRRVDNLADLLTTAEQTLAPILTQATTAQAHLLLWVRTSPDYQSKDRYLVSARFVPNANTYDPAHGDSGHRLSSADAFCDAEQGNTVGKDQLEALLRACLQEINQHHSQSLGNRELRIELLLPISLLDNAVEQWSHLAPQGMPAHLQSYLNPSVSLPPIGHRYQVLVRIAERLDPYFANVRPFWETKWATLKTAVASRQLAKQIFVSGDGSDFDTTFAQDSCLGAHLTAPADCQRRLLFMVIGATPTALWLRQAPPRTQCKRMFIDLLEHPIDEIAYRVREARQAAFAQRGDRHLGHHLALVWDDPHLVPPEAQVPNAFDLS